MSTLLHLMLALGSPALMGPCHGEVVAPGVVVLEACSLEQLVDASLYVGDSEGGEEPYAWSLAYTGKAPGRIVVLYQAEEP